jgi:ribosomal protein S18 acetylase RimI-like enzyme
MTPALRPAQAPDCPAVEAIVQAAYGHYVARIGQQPGPMLDDYAALIADGRVHVLEDTDGVLGVLVLIPEESAMLLDNVALHPRAQGRGFGRMLLDFAEQTARTAGYTQIRLYTHVMMTENIALYTRIGYRETRRGEEKGLRRVYMSKPLTALPK